MEMNGMRVGAKEYTVVAKVLAKKIFASIRPLIVLPQAAMRGERFNGDDRLIWILESGATEDEFLAEPEKACELALVAAAKSDYWYTYEKDWGYDYDEETEDCEVDE